MGTVRERHDQVTKNSNFVEPVQMKEDKA